MSTEADDTQSPPALPDDVAEHLREGRAQLQYAVGHATRSSADHTASVALAIAAVGEVLVGLTKLLGARSARRFEPVYVFVPSDVDPQELVDVMRARVEAEAARQ